MGLALIIRHPKWESAGVNPTPPSLAFSLWPTPPCLARGGWGGGRAPVQECSTAAQPTPPPPSWGLAGIAAMSSLAYQHQQNNQALTVLVNTGLA